MLQEKVNEFICKIDRIYYIIKKSIKKFTDWVIICESGQNGWMLTMCYHFLLVFP